jgi:hypothetical protein
LGKLRVPIPRKYHNIPVAQPIGTRNNQGCPIAVPRIVRHPSKPRIKKNDRDDKGHYRYDNDHDQPVVKAYLISQ